MRTSVLWLGFSPSSGDCCVKSVKGTACAQTESESFPSMVGGREVRVAVAICPGDSMVADCTGSTSVRASSTDLAPPPRPTSPSYRTFRSNLLQKLSALTKLAPKVTTKLAPKLTRRFTTFGAAFGASFVVGQSYPLRNVFRVLLPRP